MKTNTPKIIAGTVALFLVAMLLMGQRAVQSQGTVGRYTMMAVRDGIAVQDTATGAVKVIVGSLPDSVKDHISAEDIKLFGYGVPFEQLR